MRALTKHTPHMSRPFGVSLRPLLVPVVVGLALGQLVSLGIQSHAQPRYVFFATALLGLVTEQRYSAWRFGIALGLMLATKYTALLPQPVRCTTSTRRRSSTNAAMAEY